jgi:hypothetical protein
LEGLGRAKRAKTDFPAGVGKRNPEEVFSLGRSGFFRQGIGLEPACHSNFVPQAFWVWFLPVGELECLKDLQKSSSKQSRKK